MKITIILAVTLGCSSLMIAQDFSARHSSPNAIMMAAVATKKQRPSAIVTALQNKNPILAQRLLQDSISSASWSKDRKTVIMLALQNNYRNLAVRFARQITFADELGKLPNHKPFSTLYQTYTQFNFLLNREQDLLLLSAAQNNRYQQIIELLSLRKAVNQVNVDGQSALMLAAANNYISVMKALLAAGADVTLQDRYGYSALSYAAYNNSPAAVKLLIANGAKAYTAPLAGSALFVALAVNNRDFSDYFYHHPETIPSIDMSDDDGRTLLMYAAAYGSLHHVRQLLHLGADAKLRTLRGRSSLDYAFDGASLGGGALLLEEYYQISKLLLQNGGTFYELQNFQPPRRIQVLLADWQQGKF